MGHPNWQRLAELGQLPDYMKGELPVSFTEANEQARRSRGLEPNKEPAEEMKDITEIVDETKVEEVSQDDVRKELEKKSKKELQQICADNKLDVNGNKEELIERILVPREEKKEEEEKTGEFVDSLLQ